MSESKYGSWTIDALKEELKKRNAKLSGRKKELVERLEAYDRNYNFGQIDNTPSDFTMKLPSLTLYMDVNSDSQVPEITESKVESYLDLFEQTKQEKAVDMYKARFLQSIRFATEKETCFIQAKVSAEMIKRCVYKVDVCLDTHGVVLEAQCECTAGVGPQAHCKHVSLTLFALTKCKEGIITKETCTQVLQTFHQSKSYSGSPVKMQDLKMRAEGSFNDLVTWDPRPQKFRKMESYPALFKNTWINSSADNVTIRQLFKPANIPAVHQDHDYLVESGEDSFLKEMNITKISVQEQTNIERDTHTQCKSKKWQQERAKRLQSSNFGRICKSGGRADLDKLAASLTRPQNISCAPINHGRKYESIALNQYSTQNKATVKPSGILVSLDIPYLGASPDGLIGDDGLVEVKCPFTAKDSKISNETVPYIILNDENQFSLSKTHDYFYQVQGTLLCTQRKWCDFVVWTLKDMIIFRIDRDEEFIINMKVI